ncbi:IclR family transcriptional regulator [Natrinema pellirubrum DSM 15624]|uniref:Transcriptional regulator n=1 Tax=Natrinema pellirubrum (strain DSM 15624 / CIP 106293 / JCM 10476 / NCIMB 786 / 157) TaxID=797303 RepID=L0JQ67_NATP1|nr:IclR family transcriptional regulator [Natrinema pellirubrum]AGB33354.1 transcriptional regulator [Natrinema pellirubrum DSM 15624]ELY71478.1 IclR family transcriptional regulator [Natrinema pellirubrum DSM 15624]
MTDDRPRPVKTTQTSLALVRAVRESDGATLSELADRLELAKSTVHNHLHTLVDEGFLVRDGDTFHVGLQFLAFGEHARGRNPLYATARRHVYSLAETTGHEADFIVEENGRAYSLEYAIGESSRRSLSESSPFRAGNRFYMHNCASGKALLASMSESRVGEILERWGLPATTDQTITDEAELFDELEAIRRRGYAVNDEELIDGYRSIGAAVTDPDGEVLGAFSVGGPTYRMATDESTAEELAQLLRDEIGSLESTLF